jgi:hypothetical protein
MRVATMGLIVLLASLVLFANLGAAKADWDCSAPLADWQPREALVSKLEADGWRNIVIRIEDGCYLVRAVNAAGERLHGMFDPAKLTQVSSGRRHHGEGERHDEEGRGPDRMKDRERER